MNASVDDVLAAHKADCYRGIARVRLASLQFQHPLVVEKHREESSQNVRRLQRIFEKDGCFRLQDENAINAVVEEGHLDAALRVANLTAGALRELHLARDAPFLNISTVKCLTGLHRIRAADQFLDENDKWWVVRFFSCETPQPVLCNIIESCSSEQKPSDGEIFRKIRLYHRQKDEEAENRWWARLENSKPKDLRQLLKRKDLASAFDLLIDMPGLWSKVQLGALHRLLTLKCDEEMIHYLNHVAETWAKILTCVDTIIPFSAVDTATVENLQLLAPKYSTIDKDLILDLMERRILFPSQSDNRIRQQLANNICASQGLIPSLWTFFETLKYLEPICEALKQLLGSGMKRTIRSSLMGHFFLPEKNMVQISEFKEAELRTSLSRDQTAWVSYIEIKESGEAKPTVEGPNPVLWTNLAKFAISRGFRTPRAQELSDTDPYAGLAREFLRKANPISSTFSDQQVHTIICASQAVPDHEPLSNSVPSGHIDRERRSGRPFENDMRTDKQMLYFPNIYSDTNPADASWSLIRRDTFRSLFGSFDLQSMNMGQPVSSISSNSQSVPMDMELPEQRRSEDRNLQTELESLREQHHSLMSQHQGLEERNALLMNEGRDLQLKCGTLQEQDRTSSDMVITLQSKIDDLENLHLREKTALRDEVNALQKRSSSHPEIVIESHPIVVQLQAEKFNLHTERAALENKFQELQSHALTLLKSQQQHTKEEREQQLKLKELRLQCDALRLQRDEAISEHKLCTEVAIQRPAPIEVKDPFVSMLEDRHLHDIWHAHTGNNYEIFLATSNDDSGFLRGTSCIVSRDEMVALRTIVALLEGAKIYFGEELRAMDIHGRYIIHMSPTFLFTTCTMNSIIFMGDASVLARYVSAGACQQNTRLQQGTQRQIEGDADGSKKRRLENEIDSNAAESSQVAERVRNGNKDLSEEVVMEE